MLATESFFKRAIARQIFSRKDSKEMEHERNSDENKKLDNFMSIVSDLFDSLETCIENKDRTSENYSKEIQKIDELLVCYPQSPFLASWKHILESYKYYYEDSSIDIPNCYISILEKDPFCVNAYEELAVYYYINDNYTLAEKLFRTALILEPTRESLLTGLCRVLKDGGNESDFLEEQKSCIDMCEEIIDNLRKIKDEPS